MGTVGVRGSFNRGEQAPLPWDAQIARAVAKEYVSFIGLPFRVQIGDTHEKIDRGGVDTERGLRRFFYELLGKDREPEKVVQELLRKISDRVRCPLCQVPLGEARGEAPQVVHRDDGIWVCSDCFDCSTDGGYTTTRRQAAGVSAFGGGAVAMPPHPTVPPAPSVVSCSECHSGGPRQRPDDPPGVLTCLHCNAKTYVKPSDQSGAFPIDPRTVTPIDSIGAKPVDVDAPRDADALKPFERRCIAIAELVLFCEGSVNDVLSRARTLNEYQVKEMSRPSIRITPLGEGTVGAVATGLTTGWTVEMNAATPYTIETVDALLQGLLLALCWAAETKRAGLASGANGLALPNGVRAVVLGHFEVPPSNDEQTAREEAAAQTRKCRTPLGARRYLIEQGFPAARITEDVVEVLRYLILREGTSAAGAKEQLERMSQVQFQKKIAEIRGDGLGLERLSTPLKAKGGRIHLTSTVEVSGLDIARLVLGGTIRLTDSIDTEHEPGKVAVRSSSAVVVGPPWLDEWLGEPSKDDQATAGASVVIGDAPCP